jgi:hypothetical protein
MHSALLPIYELYVMAEDPPAASASRAMARKIDQAISLIAGNADRVGAMRCSVRRPVVQDVNRHNQADPTTIMKRLISVAC